MAMSQQSPQGRAPILECVREGFAFIGRDWRAIVPVAATAAVALTPLEVWSDVSTTGGDMGSGLLASILGVLVQAVVLAAYYRRALSRGVDPLVLRAGADERNVIAATFAIGFFFMIVFIVGLFIVMMALASLLVGAGVDGDSLQNLPPAEAAQAFVTALGADGRIVFFGLLSALALFLLWLSARLTLALPATVAEQRVLAFSTWGWTKGNAAPIAACLVLVLIGAIGLSILAILAPSILIGAVFGQAAMQTPGSPAHWVMSYLSAAIGLTFFLAPYAAMSAYLYRGLRPQ
ncbi:MAG: hypothetical protein NW200_10280 [Hyphomonadaceae bacterium]|nr:hypothetical protein [Hyphomonadaceae bacterium]